MKELAALGVSLWRRTKPDAVNPNKEVKLNGYLTTERTRAHWVEACATMVREKSLVCRYRPACEEFQTFVTLPSGRSEAVGGKHDDWVSCIGIGLVVKCYGVLTGAPRVEARHGGGDWNYSFAPAGPVHSYGSGAVG